MPVPASDNPTPVPAAVPPPPDAHDEGHLSAGRFAAAEQPADGSGEIAPLPDRVNRGLVAYARLKYYLSLLQSAQAHAQSPGHSRSNLHAEREASGITDEALDEVVEGSRSAGHGEVFVPLLGQTLREVWAELGLMVQPLAAAGVLLGARQSSVAVYARRCNELRARTPGGDGDVLSASALETLTRVADAKHDTVYQLLMDLHRELDGLRTVIALETIGGARTYGLGTADRTCVAAFMKGVNETTWARFDHPGLATTATRVGARLSIHTDIGTTGAHVVVVQVDGWTVTIINTDAHRRRLKHFRSLLESFDIEWRTDAASASPPAETAVGRYAAPDEAGLLRFLVFLGSRLAFLIDWNRARKRLKRFVRNAESVAILRWAADVGVGHCAFLRAGGCRLIDEALESTSIRIRGGRLDKVLGATGTRNFLTGVLGLTAAGLRSGQSRLLMRDQVEIELRQQLSACDRGLFDAAAEHATDIAALADRLRGTMHQEVVATEGEENPATGDLARRWKEHADDIVRRWSRVRDRAGASGGGGLLSAADDAADALEEAAFLFTLVPVTDQVRTAATLGELPDLVDRSAKEYVRCLEFAKQAGTTGTHAAAHAVVAAVDHIAAFQQQCDLAERAVEEELQNAGKDRQLYLLTRIAHRFEESANALTRCGVLVKDHILSAGAAEA